MATIEKGSLQEKLYKKLFSEYLKASYQYLIEYSIQKYKIKKDPPKIFLKFNKNEASEYDYEDNEITLFVHFDEFDGVYWKSLEYAHIHKDVEIGSFKSKDFRMYLDQLICHEVAHWIDDMKNKISEKNVKSTFDQNFDGWHNKKWQQYYRDLVRKSFCASKLSEKINLEISI